MARKMRVRTRTQEGLIEVQVLVSHPMETGLRTDKKTKKKVPPHFIKHVILEHNGKVVASADTGVGISADPLLGFRLKDGKDGDKIKVTWSDNKGESGSIETIVEG